MGGLNPGVSQYFTFLGLVILNSVVAGSVYQMVGSFSPAAIIATILSAAITVLFFLFGGFFVPAQIIPVWWIWLYYVSWFRYVYEAMVVNEFAGATFVCPTVNGSNVTAGCLQDGEQILRLYSVENVVVWQWCLVLFGMFVCYRVLCLIGIVWFQKEQR
jgi:hypothetical protein